MSNLTDYQRQHIIELLERGEDPPLDYKHLLFPPERQEYELVYAGKEREEDILAETMAVPLQPIKTFGNANNTDWENMLIFGDNLQAMKTLLRMKEEGKLVNMDGSYGVKSIYIDPPFATKQEFRGGQAEKAYQDKIVGVKFIEFIRKRIVLLRELLSSDGSIFVHLDQRKVHYIKLVLDEIFGEHNFRNEIIIPGRASKNLQKQFSTVARLNVRHDTLLWYSKSSETRFSTLWVEKHDKGNPEGHWHHFWSTADRRTMRYELFGHTPTTGQWVWKEERAKQAVENYERFLLEAGGRSLAEYWRDTGSKLSFIRKNPDGGTPQYWRAPASDRIADTLWAGVPIYSNKTKYPTEKNESLLERVIDMSSDVGDIALDAFAGSGTTLAVAEKLDRRWIGIDCGKLSIYTIQKRLLNLREEIGHKGNRLEARPFTLYNAGLYDFSKLKRLPWQDWRFFALHLFQCRDEQHTVGGLQLDGYRGADDVLVFNHLQHGGVVLDYGFVEDLHNQIGGKVGSRFFIIAPAASVTFLEDYLDRGQTRYYILRIPYSIINELHTRDFEAITQPIDENQVNETVEAVGFDFMRLPTIECDYLAEKAGDGTVNNVVIRLKTFKSKALVKGATQKGNRETLSMVMIDYDYDGEGEVFEMDAAFYAGDIEKKGWEIQLPARQIGQQVMIIYIDIYGNEYKEVKTMADFQPLAQPAADQETADA